MRVEYATRLVVIRRYVNDWCVFVYGDRGRQNLPSLFSGVDVVDRQ